MSILILSSFMKVNNYGKTSQIEINKKLVKIMCKLLGVIWNFEKFFRYRRQTSKCWSGWCHCSEKKKCTACEVWVKIMGLDLICTEKAHISQNSRKITKLLAQNRRNNSDFWRTPGENQKKMCAKSFVFLPNLMSCLYRPYSRK